MKGETLLVSAARRKQRAERVLLPAGAVPGRVSVLTEAITELVKAELGVSVVRGGRSNRSGLGALVARASPRGAFIAGERGVPKDLAKTDFIREFIDLLARNAPSEPAQARRA
jgi:hypothetical protein